ncbi:hypothetical protein L211DRAFT_235571 [Terfezia boudieri ATCC MYA-4762]|uniref:HNH nuclease domain-containing protein n=1 Tax=Terfezia boudieri ATCC MYA-4762 TaxID=1051890 RepID=A0A3N4LLK3_9PEZI|nr:hypothetical protein L211DRAFT_235571 [Terfezia boudieri ATCC MYA-4762]
MATKSKAWFKIINPESKWGRVTLEGIESRGVEGEMTIKGDVAEPVLPVELTLGQGVGLGLLDAGIPRDMAEGSRSEAGVAGPSRSGGNMAAVLAGSCTSRSRSSRRSSILGVGSASFTDPTSTTKSEVAEREGGTCWLCGRIDDDSGALEVAHHISRIAIRRFLYYKGINVLPATLTHLAHPDNLILLCTVCHHAFDAAHPSWVMVPTEETLNVYIQHEQRDYQSRRQAGLRGERQLRTLPNIDKGVVLYQPCILSEGFPLMEPSLKPSTWPKIWGGEPTAVIIKALLGLFQPCEPQAISRPGHEDVTISVPGALDTKCAQLNKLWSRPPPQVSEPTPSKGKKRVRGVDEEDKGKGGEEDDGVEGYGREGRREKRSRVKSQVTPSDRNLQSQRPAKVEFAYGPDSTSQDAIDRALGCLEKHPDSKRKGEVVLL